MSYIVYEIPHLLCTKLMLCPHSCVFTSSNSYVHHSTSSDASNTCLTACLIGVEWLYVRQRHVYSLSEGASDAYTRAFLCSSKACIIVQAVTQVTHALVHMPLEYFMPLKVRFDESWREREKASWKERGDKSAQVCTYLNISIPIV